MLRPTKTSLAFAFVPYLGEVKHNFRLRILFGIAVRNLQRYCGTVRTFLEFAAFDALDLRCIPDAQLILRAGGSGNIQRELIVRGRPSLREYA